MRRVQIRVDGDTAYCDELSCFCSDASQEEAIRELSKLIKLQIPDAILVLPYMGQDFSPKWEELRLKPPPKEDEFEEDQKRYEFAREKEIL